ncbi:1-deoxy-D-xylulose-5-phosphate reductoisomerase [Cellulosilyticum lentocellum]|uniref:1-deoxy-D-xylulose 5-phosphate reductoisomerase n=1 Tax=Cellulosilyticum lentocellum (strain ATCC 49066 / DSM 5427 / NCIMB 11756 / RHM5) TaxID=642492 RepID=F2JGN5_CELLD|nr:1-deoxy-D-xylulose-5-phosphate reductoisomerase [Cellulosilyticum lentocellum]ADZ84127.1 1-deoxy-D-xylulose 5-phosphate reductoisomerase [Cellulosilyticum lentocellum DSM 5427]
MQKKIVILGSTGSIGTQTLDVVGRNKDIQVAGLAAYSNIDLLEEQIIAFKPQVVCVMLPEKATLLEERLKVKQIHTEVISGEEGLVTLATLESADMIVTAVVGMIGLLPTLAAIKAGKTIALANKETLVTAGELVMRSAKENKVGILPVDSEHSAIFQALRGNEHKSVSKLILTASGGPFRTYTKEQLEQVTVEAALKHPNWAMGSKITIDSASLMNKGLEVIEAKYLFDVEPSQIDVIVHKESIIHSMVEYVDGSTIAQLGQPDMRHPIAYALYYPERTDASYIKSLDFASIGTLSFEAPKKNLFPCLQFAYDALEIGGTMPAVLNAANEVVVASFLNKQIRFLDIPKIIHMVMEKHICINRPTLEDILGCDEWAREYSRKKVTEL